MKPWVYDPSPAVHQDIAAQLTVFPREPDLSFSLLRRFWTIGLRCFLKLYFRLTIHGKENLPLDKSCVLVANHSSHLDAAALSAAFPLRLIDSTFAVAAKDYFFGSFFKSFFAAIFVNALPFDRKIHRRESLELCADTLGVSRCALIMFPEGTRSADGKLQEFKKGLGILTAGTDRIVVPAYIEGAFAAWPKGNVFPKPHRVTVHIGTPLTFKDAPRNEEGFKLVTRRAQAAVAELKPKESSSC